MVKTGVQSESSGLSSERIILSPFTKEFRGEGHSYESLNFSEAPFFGAVIVNPVRVNYILLLCVLQCR